MKMDANTISTIISCAAAIVSIVAACVRFVFTRYAAVDEFLTEVESEKFINAKNVVYNSPKLDIRSKEAAIVVNFFHHWGLLVKKWYLPMWVFKGATGRGAIRLYYCLQDYITERRKVNDDELYGEHFEDLVKKLEKRRGIKEYAEKLKAEKAATDAAASVKA